MTIVLPRLSPCAFSSGLALHHTRCLLADWLSCLLSLLAEELWHSLMSALHSRAAPSQRFSKPEPRLLHSVST